MGSFLLIIHISNNRLWLNIIGTIIAYILTILNITHVKYFIQYMLYNIYHDEYNNTIVLIKSINSIIFLKHKDIKKMDTLKVLQN